MYQNFLGGPVDDAPLAAIPGLATPADLAAFPATLMINGDVDELRVSGEVFAATLAEAGREIDVVIEPGTTTATSTARTRTRHPLLSTGSPPASQPCAPLRPVPSAVTGRASPLPEPAERDC